MPSVPNVAAILAMSNPLSSRRFKTSSMLEEVPGGSGLDILIAVSVLAGSKCFLVDAVVVKSFRVNTRMEPAAR